MLEHPVYIVGAGPGDPDLLTCKAHRLLTEVADVVIYDRLIPEAILSIIPDDVEMIYAGKSCRKHHMTQCEINDELVRYAKTGKAIVRLKGGDPFIFGRGGEEVEHLHKHEIPFEIIPGISAASGISAVLGIPLTHRGVANGIHFITGHQQNGKHTEYDWQGLADPETTLVIYMGLANLENIKERLIDKGLSEGTPAVAIQNGTTDKEKICFATLETIIPLLKDQGFQPPTIVIIGSVVKVAMDLRS